MKRRSILNLVMVGCIAAVACVDLSAPAGPASISELLLPATFVVANQCMLDTTGREAPPMLIAYDQHGGATAVAGASFFITDSIPYAKLVNNVICGDSVGTAHVLGQTGKLQTSVFPLPVSAVEPSAIERVVGSDTDTIRVPFGGDSGSTQGSRPIPLRVAGGLNAPSPIGADTGVNGVWVIYDSLVMPASRDKSRPAAFIRNAASHDLSRIDTTSASGQTTNEIVVIGAFLGDSAVAAGLKTDSVVIYSHFKYKNATFPIRLVMPVKVTFTLK